MLNGMAHRGPDGRGLFGYKGGAAGMVRLALVDLSRNGEQPFWSHDKKVALIYNGEIYNFRSERLRLENKGYHFCSTSDTEVILALYLERGIDFVHQLRGMYALAIFDWRKSKEDESPVLILARDPFGIKPLYISKSLNENNSILFASEIRSLLASEMIPREINREALTQYLSHGFVIEPCTIIENVRMMEAGTIEIYQPNGDSECRTFFQLPDHDPCIETLDEAAERLRAVMDESVRLHAFADVPVGAFLSGGVDSGGIVGLMQKNIPHLKTYTLRYADDKDSDESYEAVAAANYFDCDNTIIEITNSEMPELLPVFAGQMDQPSSDGLNTWLISRGAARDVKGILSGLGGDEWFAGYPVTRRMARYTESPMGKVESAAGHLAKFVAGAFPKDFLNSKAKSLASRRSMLTTWLQGHSVFSDESVKRMVGGNSSRLDKFKERLDAKHPGWRKETAVGLSCLLDVEIFMGCQLLRDSDATSMAHSLELRMPFVDLEVAKFSRSCADEFKLKKGGGDSLQYDKSGAKRVLIHALRDVLPPETISRKKRGFSLPFLPWMRGVLRPLIEDTCNSEVIKKRGLLDEKECRILFEKKENAPAGFLYPQLWSIMILELWSRKVLDK